MYLNINIILWYDQAWGSACGTVLISPHSHGVFVNITAHSVTQSHVKSSELRSKFNVGIQALEC